MNPQDVLKFVNFDRIPVAVTIFVVGLIAVRVFTVMLDRAGERFTERRLLFKKISAIMRFAVYFTLILMTASSVLHLTPEALLAVGGTVGVALGFAFKDLFTSLMAGVILLFDQPFQVGDRVTFDGYYGEIKSIGLRSVRLVTLDDNLVTIPNNKFLFDSVANANAGALDCMVVIPFYLAPDSDFVTARELVREAAATSRYVYLNKPLVTLVSDEYVGFQFTSVIRVKAYVFDARHEKAFASDVTERVKVALRTAKIPTIAPPQQAAA